MFRRLLLAGCLNGALCILPVSAQVRSIFMPPKSPVPVPNSTLIGDLAIAHVYVTGTPVNSSNNQIDAFSVNFMGKLTPVTGSPFSFDDTSMSVNRNKLMALNRTTPEIDAYSIAGDGALTYLTSTDWAQNNPSDCGSAAWLFPDRTGTDVYAMEFNGDCANNTYQSFAVQGSGAASYLGVANGGAGSFFGVYLPASFLGNNVYAYEATNNGCMYYEVWSFKRASDGLLTSSSASTTLPAPPSGYSRYLPAQLTTDPTDHVAIALWPANPPGCSAAPQQVGSFTADAKGNLTTTNTSADMPSTAITMVNDMKISPEGNLLAVGGVGGLQVFHFKGANPPTAYTGVLTTDTINQTSWDRFNHLYALSQSAGKLHVFTVTASSAEEAPGSPYTINQPQYLAVQSR